MRGLLEKAHSRLSLLHEFLSGKEAAQVTAPTDEALDLARTCFDKGVDLYECI